MAAGTRGSGDSDDSDDLYQGTSSRAGKAVSARRGGGKRKRGTGAGRGAVACQSCRLSKVACDLAHPACGACVAKGEDGLCSLGNLLWYDNPEDAPAAKLKAHIDRLESMVLKIRDNSSSGARSSSRGSPTDSSAHAPSSSSSSAGGSQRQANSTHEAEHLGRLLLGSVGTVAGHLPSGVDIGAMLSSLRYSDATTEEAPLAQLAEPNLALSRPSPETFNNIFQIMPTRHQAAQAVLFYFARCDMLHVIYRPRFDAQCLAFWETGSVPDPHWLATFLCVTANGLLAMGDDEAAQCQMPVGDGRGLLARSWLDGALKALFSGDFLKTPSLEAVRAVVLLNQFWATWQAGKHLASATSFNTSVIAAAFELDLHRDPDDLQHQFSPLEAEERRRVFWGLFSVDSLIRSFLGKTYAPLDPALITTRLPSHLPDEAYTSSGDFDFSFTPQSGSNSMLLIIAIHSVCIIMQKVSKLVGASLRASAAEIAHLHDELQAIEVAHSPALQPAAHMGETLADSGNRFVIQALLSLAFVRLHRSALDKSPLDSPTADGVWHRSVCLQHCNKLLDTFESSATTNSIGQFMSGLATGSAAITLAVDLLDMPYETTKEETRSRLAILVSMFETPTWASSTARVLRRAAVVTRHLTAVIDQQQVASISTGMPAYGAGHGHSRSASDSTSDASSFVNTPSSFLLHPNHNQTNRRSSDQASVDRAFFSPNPSEQSLASFTDSFADSFYPGDSYDYSTGNQRNFKLMLDAEPAEPLLKPWLTSQFGDVSWGWATPAVGSTALVHSLFS